MNFTFVTKKCLIEKTKTNNKFCSNEPKIKFGKIFQCDENCILKCDSLEDMTKKKK